MQHIIATLAHDWPSWHDDLWLVDSTPVECGRSRETAKRSDLAGWAGYGYCASSLAFLLGIAPASGRHTVGTADHVRVDEPESRRTRRRARHVRISTPVCSPGGTGQVLIADKGYRSAEFERRLDDLGVELIRPPTRRETAPTRTAPTPLDPPDHRVDQPHVEGQAQPRTSRRPHPTRRRHPHHPTTPRAHRRDLAQPPRHPPVLAITHRLRPLTPWNWSSTGGAGRTGRGRNRGGGPPPPRWSPRSVDGIRDPGLPPAE